MAISTGVNATGLTVTELPEVSVAGRSVRRFEIANQQLAVEVMEYGATVLSVKLQQSGDNKVCLTRGLATPEDYANNTAYMGSICGRYAGRIANARFSLPPGSHGASHLVQLTANHGQHQLHGGERGFNARHWTAQVVQTSHRAGVEFCYLSPDGEEGYPGALHTRVSYLLDNSARLWIEYEAEALDQTTAVNLTNHCYWNLGDDALVLSHELQLAARSVLEFDNGLLPTGDSVDVKAYHHGALDFSQPRVIGDAHQRLPSNNAGLDHAFHGFVGDRVPLAADQSLHLVANVLDRASGRSMQVFTDQPSIVVYAGGGLDGSQDHGGNLPFSGLCIECQQFPDAPNQPQFPSPFVSRGQKYRQTTVYAFAAPELLPPTKSPSPDG